MDIYKDINPILIGSRSYGVYEDDSDYDVLLLVPDDRVSTVISAWLEGEVYNLMPYENPKRYNITAKTRGLKHLEIPGIPQGAVYDITIVPKGNMSDSKFISSNWTIKLMINTSKIEEEHVPELKRRLSLIRKWTKENNVYGGAYPSGISYFIYAYNTIKFKYSYEESLSLLYQKHLYYHQERGYSHMKYVGLNAFQHIKDLILGKVPDLPIRYKIETKKGLVSNALRAVDYLLRELPFRTYSTSDGYIYSERSINASPWLKDLKSYDIEAKLVTT